MYKNKLTEGQSAKNTLLKSLLKTLSTNSQETEEHALRLRKLALAIGNEIGLAEFELDKLSLLTSLHDIGKIVVPQSLLMKKGELTDKEWDIIKTHPEKGYRIASATPEFAHVADDILSHHERWDGGGYPRGFEGDRIPLPARIVAIVDAYDAMVNQRPHNHVLTHSEALDEIRRCAGTQFDPHLVDVFLEIMGSDNAPRTF